MRAVVYHGPGRKQWEEVPKPSVVDDGDAIVRVDAVTICGTDLHILKGDVPAVTDGRILGHEAVGTVEEVGAGVRTLAPGDKVSGTATVSRLGGSSRCLQGPVGGLGGPSDGPFRGVSDEVVEHSRRMCDADQFRARTRLGEGRQTASWTVVCTQFPCAVKEAQGGTRRPGVASCSPGVSAPPEA
jgi:hypothetical protein